MSTTTYTRHYNAVASNREAAVQDAIRMHRAIGMEYGWDSAEAKAVRAHIREHKACATHKAIHTEALLLCGLEEDNSMYVLISKASMAKAKHLRATAKDVVVARTTAWGTVPMAASTTTNTTVA